MGPNSTHSPAEIIAISDTVEGPFHQQFHVDFYNDFLSEFDETKEWAFFSSQWDSGPFNGNGPNGDKKIRILNNDGGGSGGLAQDPPVNGVVLMDWTDALDQGY